jgi:hypothetical protein
MLDFYVTSDAPDGGDSQFAEANQQMKDAIARAMFRIANLGKAVARRYAPISPTTTLLKRLKKGGGRYEMRATKKRKASTITLTDFYTKRLDALISGNDSMPGGLTMSIQGEARDNVAEIYVPANSPAGEYAGKIHDERGITWINRGPGTQAKGPQAKEKFIERAINDSRIAFETILKAQVAKAIAGQAGNGPIA